MNKYLQTGKKDEIKANALPEGSFLVHLSVETLNIIDAVHNILKKKITNYRKSNIVETVVGVYAIKKILKGKKPKKLLLQKMKPLLKMMRANLCSVAIGT